SSQPALPHRALRSFPTRRSSDLIGIGHGNRNASSKQYSRNPSEFSLRRPTKDSRVVLNEPVVCVQARVGRVKIDQVSCARRRPGDRKSTRLNSSHRTISYAVFCL